MLHLSGTARVIDSDTISIADTRIRLWGIDAPEREQTCLGKYGDIYECGRDSGAVLSELTLGRRLECTQRDYDRYGRVVAVCRTESGELNMAMVRPGWAVDDTKYSGGRYQSDEEQARREQLGSRPADLRCRGNGGNGAEAAADCGRLASTSLSMGSGMTPVAATPTIPVYASLPTNIGHVGHKGLIAFLTY